MPEEILPGYRYDTSTGRYRSNVTGRFVPRQQIVGLLDSAVSGGADKLASLTTALAEGKISPATFVEQMGIELKRMHLQNRALGAGGWDRLTPQDYGAVGGKLQADYARLVNFADDIQSGKISLAQALNRSNMYAGNARTQYWKAMEDRMVAQPGMVAIERRQLGAAEHCGDCVSYYDQGWQPIGTLPVPGELSQCQTNCRCVKIYREVNVLIVGEWLGTKR